MRVIERIDAMRDAAAAARAAQRRVALVPTMGCLHAGHLSLVRLARARADTVVVSLFVNPTQFGPGEDLARYPRTLERDLEACAAEGVEIVFAPDAAAVYWPDSSTVVEETRVSRGFCGAGRPGHFRGVTTVVAKLFHIVDPDLAVFGEKDIQQARVIARIVRDLDMRVELVFGPIVREADGLAMSSRNRYLAARDRARAAGLYRALCTTAAAYRAGARASAALQDVLARALKAADLDGVEYAAVVDPDTLEPVSRLEHGALALAAVRVGPTRLIDNLRLDAAEPA
jgi:pantoate--beta-alanine ligase